MVLPLIPEFFPTINLERLSASLYSSTSSSNDLVLRFSLSLPSPFFAKNHLLNGKRTIIPITIHISPTGVKAKKPNCSYPAPVNTSWITRLGGVPISVSIPPKLLANASGISRREALTPDLAARLTTMGNIKATVPVLLTNAPINDVTTMISRNKRSSLLPANLSMRPLIILARPV
ncbi:unknown [Prevotella sp. CAG:1124]|nr:unknown [Prevotella sp. CAG:1124]